MQPTFYKKAMKEQNVKLDVQQADEWVGQRKAKRRHKTRKLATREGKHAVRLAVYRGRPVLSN
jgi:hypothetical protein